MTYISKQAENSYGSYRTWAALNFLESFKIRSQVHHKSEKMDELPPSLGSVLMSFLNQELCFPKPKEMVSPRTMNFYQSEW